MTLSINTNTAAMAALESLSATSKSLTATESQVSTGKKVASAADNPAIYAISQSMSGNIAGLSAVSDSLSLGAQVVNTASKAASDIVSTLQTLQQTVTQAGTTGIDTATMKTQVADAINQINLYARNSTFNGVNILTSTGDSGSATNATANVVTGLQGSTISIANQASAISAGATVLTNALGLSSLTNGGTATGATQNVLNSSATGVNISSASTLAATSFANGTNVVLTDTSGKTTTFEFDDGTAATTSKGTATNHVVVILTSASDSSSTLSGKLVDSMNANGFNAVLQNDGSINVTGKGLASSTSTVTGLNTGTPLSESSSAITTIQSAINKMNTISTTLGSTTQQITGMQSFTSDLSDALTTGVGGLTDADLSAASAKLTSLQTKQSLAIQSLSIANSQSQSILSLFR